MEDLGWEAERDIETVELTMPGDSLARTLKRLRRDARRAPCEERHELEAKDSDCERWERFRQAVDRAECHEGAEEVWVFIVAEHLGFEPTPKTVAALHPQLEDLRRAGLLSRNEAQGRERWGLTTAGQEELGKRREAGEIGELAESPQHRVWRHARVEAAVRIEEFKREVAELWEETDRLLSQRELVLSTRWFDLSERFRRATWRLGSTHCIDEWVEPEDDEPDVDENPGPAPGRRTVAAWDGLDSEPGGPA
ncbi:MAG TPA: hypothetical protein VK471_08235 [Solirubrobacterales bacterium]|nr:hypothetical protein [Solirubrobacterales bacterium]